MLLRNLSSAEILSLKSSDGCIFNHNLSIDVAPRQNCDEKLPNQQMITVTKRGIHHVATFWETIFVAKWAMGCDSKVLNYGNISVSLLSAPKFIIIEAIRTVKGILNFFIKPMSLKKKDQSFKQRKSSCNKWSRFSELENRKCTVLMIRHTSQAWLNLGDGVIGNQLIAVGFWL